MSDPLIPRIHITTCEDYHVISQALFLLANDTALENTKLGRAAKELSQYFDRHEREIHTDHNDDGQTKVAELLADLYNNLPQPDQRTAILALPENQLDSFMSTVRKDGK